MGVMNTLTCSNTTAVSCACKSYPIRTSTRKVKFATTDIPFFGFSQVCLLCCCLFSFDICNVHRNTILVTYIFYWVRENQKQMLAIPSVPAKSKQSLFKGSGPKLAEINREDFTSLNRFWTLCENLFKAEGHGWMAWPPPSHAQAAHTCVQVSTGLCACAHGGQREREKGHVHPCASPLSDAGWGRFPPWGGTTMVGWTANYRQHSSRKSASPQVWSWMTILQIHTVRRMHKSWFSTSGCYWQTSTVTQTKIHGLQ